MSGDAHTRTGSDERRGFADRYTRGAATKITKSFASELGAITARSRKRAVMKVKREIFVTGKDRDLSADAVMTRRAAVATAIPLSVGAAASIVYGEATLTSFDAREAFF